MLGRPSGLMIQSRFVFYFAAGCLLFSRCYMLDEISLLAEGEHIALRNIHQDKHYSPQQLRHRYDHCTAINQALIKYMKTTRKCIDSHDVVCEMSQF